MLRKFAFSAALLASAGLAACQQGAAPTSEETSSAATESLNGPNAKPGISASEGRLVLPVVEGNPAAVYFKVRNDSEKAASLVGVHVANAGKAEMHKTEGGKMSAVEAVELKPGESVAFAPGGYHVMAFETAKMPTGGTTELTLTFSDGDKLSMPLMIETMGDAMGGQMEGMEGMHH